MPIGVTITAEKKNAPRSNARGHWLLYFAKIPADHLPFRSTRRVCSGERQRACFSERKGLKKAYRSGKYPDLSLWDHQASGSNPVTPTTSPRTLYRSRRLSFGKANGSLTPSLLLSEKGHAAPSLLACKRRSRRSGLLPTFAGAPVAHSNLSKSYNSTPTTSEQAMYRLL